MIEFLYKDPEIQSFLNIFPKESWKKCIYLTLVYGIRAIQRETSYSKLSLLESLVFPQKTTKKAKNHSISHPIKTPKPDFRHPSLPTEHKEKASSKRTSSPAGQKAAKKYKMPSYLKNVQSKIKEEVQKDLAVHRYEKETFVSPVYRQNRNKSMPELFEVKEPDVCPIEKIDKNMGPGLVLMAEKFLTNPFMSLLSPK